MFHKSKLEKFDAARFMRQKGPVRGATGVPDDREHGVEMIRVARSDEGRPRRGSNLKAGAVIASGTVVMEKSGAPR